MPTKGNLPSAMEMEGQVLAALQELGGVAYYAEIDERVKKNLEPFVYVSEFKKENETFYETTFGAKCAVARRSLRKQRLVDRGKKQGCWQLNAHAPPPPKISGTNTVTSFAAEAEKRLKASGASDGSIEVIRQLWWEMQMNSPEPQPDPCHNRKVEKAAIGFIRRSEPDWQSANTRDNPNNPGYDLYQTDKNGRIMLWCEVKSSSGKFSRVSLSAKQFAEARKRGKKYWLYIVENAETAKPQLIKINDPAGRAERFYFQRSPWRGVAERF